jgi:phage gp16-like protein
MEAIKGKGKKAPHRLEKQRLGLLAKVHIAKKDLGLDETLYRLILRNEYGVESAKALSNKELANLVQRFESKGWVARTSELVRGAGSREQAEALKERVGQELIDSALNEQRVRGLCKSICGVADLAWARDPRTLKRLLVVIRRIKEQEGTRTN